MKASWLSLRSSFRGQRSKSPSLAARLIKLSDQWKSGYNRVRSWDYAPSPATATTSFQPAFHPHSSVANTTSLLRWLAFNRKRRFCVFSFALRTAAQFPTQEQLPHVSCKHSPHLLTFHPGFSRRGREPSQPFKSCCSVVQAISAPQPGGMSPRFQLAKPSRRAASTRRWTSATSRLPKRLTLQLDPSPFTTSPGAHVYTRCRCVSGSRCKPKWEERGQLLLKASPSEVLGQGTPWCAGCHWPRRLTQPQWKPAATPRRWRFGSERGFSNYIHHLLMVETLSFYCSVTATDVSKVSYVGKVNW